MPLFGAPAPTVGDAPEARARLAAILSQRAENGMHGGNMRGVANMPNQNELNAIRALDSGGSKIPYELMDTLHPGGQAIPMEMVSPRAQAIGAAGAGLSPAQLAAALQNNPNLGDFTLPAGGGVQPY